MLDRHPQRDKGTKEPIAKLNDARRDDKRPDLGAHRPDEWHRISFPSQAELSGSTLPKLRDPASVHPRRLRKRISSISRNTAAPDQATESYRPAPEASS